MKYFVIVPFASYDNFTSQVCYVDLWSQMEFENHILWIE